MKSSRTLKRKVELLAPAGNFEGLVGAINAGCDAVYIGGKAFGARAYADNFSDEEIVKAIKYAHLFDVKIYLTVNTLVKEREFDKAVEFVAPFVKVGLDAFIVQDIGLANVLRDTYPETEIHMSTQCFITGPGSAQFFKEFGATRVVLARELSLKEIETIKKTVDIELETFIHGAMCYCYSGQCLFSSALGGRSGNRGRCAGPCRQMYDAIVDGKEYHDRYFLSMKDQCTLTILDKLLDAGIDSLKIEGRMKKPEYTAFVTSVYRKYIDLYNSGGDFFVDPKDIEKLRSIYMRSEIGTGYYERQKGREMMSLDNPGYSGNDDALMLKIRKRYVEVLKKAKITGYFSASAKTGLSLTLCYKDISVTATDPMCEEAKSRPTTKDDIERSLSKLGNTPFEFEELYIETVGDCFIPVKTINELRRKATEDLLNEI